MQIRTGLSIISFILFGLFETVMYANDNKDGISYECFFNDQQKVFLHLNKNVFITGEDVLFKAYLVNYNNIPDTLCKVLYIELVSPSNQKLVSFSVGLNNGSGNSFFTLPDTILTGYYYIRAYTNQMRNYNHEDYFSIKIMVANQADEKLEKFITNTYHNSDSVKLALFPECGHILADEPNKIVFFISEFNNDIQNQPIQIIDDSVHIVGSAFPDKNGLGEVSFTPKKNLKYIALWNNKKYPLHSTQTEANLIKSNYENGVLNIYIKNKISGISDVLKLVAFCNGVYSEREFTTYNGNANVQIAADKMPGGYITILLLSSGKLLAQQNLFIPIKSDNPIALSTDKSEYSCRQKVKVNIALKNIQNKIKYNLSLSVSQNAPVKNAGIYNNIDNSFQFFSKIDNRSKEILEKDSLSEAQINELVTTNQTHSPTLKTCLFLPENDGFIITGRLLNKNNEVVPSVCVYLSVVDSFTNLKYCFTDTSGRFFFRLNHFYENKNIIFQAKGNNNEHLKIDLEDKYNDEPSQKTGFEYINNNLKNYLKNAQNISLLNKVYKTSNLLLMDKGNQIDTVSYNYHFYGIPDATIHLSDYDELDDFKEIVRNIMPGVYYDRSENKIRVYDRGTQTLWPDEALVFLNNIPFPDPIFISKLGSKQIRKIDIKKNHLIYGDLDVYGKLDIYGIISITTNPKNVYALNPAYASLAYPYVVRNIPVIITGPNYSTKSDSYNPDFRPTLFWEPNLKLFPDGTASVEFYTSDLNGKYTIDLQGVSENGIPVSISKIIEVK